MKKSVMFRTFVLSTRLQGECLLGQECCAAAKLSQDLAPCCTAERSKSRRPQDLKHFATYAASSNLSMGYVATSIFRNQTSATIKPYLTSPEQRCENELLLYALYT